ncbi:MAG TPA: HAD family hydrolase [Candidatus Binataceae bacterium]|nr:HAD family hydrolase [Candidatus Binataceae bacterium]
MLELVIFDADGVLFDSTESNIAYYNEIFTRVGEPPMSPVEEKACIFMAAPQVFDLRAAGDRQLVARMREVARTLDAAPFFALFRPVPGLRSLLLKIKQQYRIGLATNRSATIPGIIDYLGLVDIFDAVASVRDRVKPKPAPDILELCLKRAGVGPEDAVYVGDSETDRIASQAAKLNFIGVGERVVHQHSIARLEELPAMLEVLCGSDARVTAVEQKEEQ